MKRKSLLRFILCLFAMGTVTILSGCRGNIDTDESTESAEITDSEVKEENTQNSVEQEEAIIEVLTGTGWWDGDESSQDYVLSGDGYMVFEIHAEADNDGSVNAYCVEAYDTKGHYLTTTSDSTAWYANTTGAISSVNGAASAVPGETVRVIFTREGNQYTVEYLDAQTEEYIFDKIVAIEDGNFEKELKLHVMAEIGTFEVAMVEAGTGKYVKQTENTDAIVMEGMTRLEVTDDAGVTTYRKRASVHDPSIVVGYINESVYTGKERVFVAQSNSNNRTKVYFVFGTCLSFAYSNDLENWTIFENNLSTDYERIFAKEKEWAQVGKSDYSLFWSIWAPDVMWNPDYENENGTKGAWMMYVSINGPACNSAIALLTTTDLGGDWTYRGTVLYSGYSEKGTTFDYTKTDYLKYAELDPDGTLPDRYVTRAYLTSVSEKYNTWNVKYAGHAIDPMVFFDEEGTLRLIYGSFAGGIFMLEIDPATGFRNDRVYELDAYTGDGTLSDPYCGIKIAGGNDISVEGAYIKYWNGKYYLFLSVGGCYTYTGYNMRVFSSENVEGIYTDYLGNRALDAGAIDGKSGARLMFNYKWDWKERAQLAQGHNSVYLDEKGDMFLFYHEKTDNGTNDNIVKVHQVFLTSSGAPVVAPFEYSRTDETDVVYSEEEIVGEYEILLHTTTDYANLKCNTTSKVTLNANHTITGDIIGRWRLEKGTYNVILTFDEVEFHGRFLKQTMEDTNVETFCFTTISQDLATDVLWGVKVPSDADCVRLAMEHMPSVDKKLKDGMTLSTEGILGTHITWYCNSECVSKEGAIVVAENEEKVTIYAVVSKGGYYSVKSYINRVVTSR
ncbi:MAG: glycoside hydrolase family 43 protein [Lachnospiraceae bacterium]|nr:glycoside hydrolase family 43 protein [Lachnospiraceae bacterium]